MSEATTGIEDVCAGDGAVVTAETAGELVVMAEVVFGLAEVAFLLVVVAAAALVVLAFVVVAAAAI